MKDSQLYTSAAAIGAIAGMRAMSAPAVISQVVRKGELAVEGSKLGFLNTSGALSISALLAVGELIADKLPSTPNRTDVGPLVARAISGGLSGAVIFSAKKKSPWAGGLLGALTAVAATYAAFHLRRSVKEKLHIPDVVLAAAEDALVARAGVFVVRQLHPATAF